MRLNEMNVDLRAKLDIFNHELEQAGWQVNDFGKMLKIGISVNPEGIASFNNGMAILEAHLSLSERELGVFILQRNTGQMVRLILAFRDGLEGIIHSLIGMQDRLDANAFPQFLLQTYRLAERIWFVDHEGTRLPLTFPSSTDA